MKVFDNEIYSYVKSKILEGEYAPGSRINLRALGEIFRTSRLPIRDALHRLNGEGLVQQHPNGGHFVTPLTEVDIRETYEMRGIMEGYLVAQAALNFTQAQIASLEENLREQQREKENIENYSRLNKAFHETFFQATHNTKFLKMLRQLRDYQDRFDQINWMTNGQPFVNVTYQAAPGDSGCAQTKGPGSGQPDGEASHEHRRGVSDPGPQGQGALAGLNDRGAPAGRASKERGSLWGRRIGRR